MCLAGTVEVCGAAAGQQAAAASDQQNMAFWNMFLPMKTAQGEPAEANLDRGFPEVQFRAFSEADYKKPQPAVAPAPVAPAPVAPAAMAPVAVEVAAVPPPPTPVAAPTVPAETVKESHVLDKTKLCKFFVKGQCRRGQACTFAHGKRQLRAQPDLFRTQLCNDFATTGLCRFGSDCRYAHSEADLRAPEKHQKPAAAPKLVAAGCTQGKAQGNAVGNMQSDAKGDDLKRASLESELAEVKAHMEQLQAQVRALEHERQMKEAPPSPPAAQAAAMSPPPPRCASKDRVEASWASMSFDSEWEESFGHTSSETTTAQGYSSSSDSGDDVARGSSLTSIMDDVEESVDVAYVVKHTFLTAVPADDMENASSRRAASAPPPAQRGCSQ